MTATTDTDTDTGTGTDTDTGTGTGTGTGTDTGVPTMIVAEVTVRRVERLSASFVRVELGADELADFGVDGPLLDQRVKLVFPGPSGRVPFGAGPVSPTSWYASWLALPAAERGSMRTYTVRAVRGAGPDTRVVVDLVLHLAPGADGPASRWAARARVGDRLGLVGPRRGHPYGGIEFDPADATRLLLAGDETALPAIASILECLPADAAGTAYVEVPTSQDVQLLSAPAGMRVTWLPRDGAAHGERLRGAVLTLFGLADASSSTDAD